MPHQAPAENNAATATRPIATLSPGRELPGRGRRRRNCNTRGACAGVADSSFSDRISDGISNGTAKGSSTTLSSVNSTKAAGMIPGCASDASSGTSSGIEDAGGACSVAEKIAVAGDGASPVSTPITRGSSGCSITAASATTGASAFPCRTSPATSDSQWMRRSWSSGLSAERTSSANRSKQRTS